MADYCPVQTGYPLIYNVLTFCTVLKPMWKKNAEKDLNTNFNIRKFLTKKPG